jgi:rhomboid family GlyGly-CTERM serine protease
MPPKRLPLFTSALAALAVFAHVSPDITSALQFSQHAVAQGQLWRLFTAHFTHFGASHLGWDLAVFVAFGAWVETTCRTAFLRIVLVSAPAVSLVLWAFQPEVIVYRGLSGIDSALFAFVVSQLIQRAWRHRDHPVLALAGLALGGFAIKIFLELFRPSPVFVSDSSFAPSPLAHAVGALVGLALAFREAGQRCAPPARASATAPPGA